MVKLIDLFKRVLNLHREHGLKIAIEYILAYLNMRTPCVYSTIKYPITNHKVRVRSIYSIDFWKGLEKGLWELNCIKLISNTIEEGQTILDVGGWVGPYTLLFSKLLQARGQVYTFEPDPKAVNILYDNIQKNYLTNVHIERICLSNSIGNTKLKSRQFGYSGSSIVRHNMGTDLKEITVETTTIDKYCEENHIVPDGIKIDVEGAEGLVMDGASKVIKKHKPWVLLEFHGQFMSEKERRKNWNNMVKHAKKIVFIDGNSTQYRYGSTIKSLPYCANFHIFIKY